MPHYQFNWQTLEKLQSLHTYYYDTPIGSLAIEMQGKLLNRLYWLLIPPLEAQNSSLPGELRQLLNQYWLTGKMTISTCAAPILGRPDEVPYPSNQNKCCIGLLKQGTEFQQKVWHALCEIPIGQTKTYGELAIELKTAPRALANACRQNPFPIIIPCHRILAKAGIGGYAGTTSGKLIDIKTALLKHEKIMAYDI